MAMRRIRKLSSSLVIWLTAVMTVVAGTPRFACQCSAATVTSRCCDSTSGCCCAGACCAKKQSTSDPGLTCCRVQKGVRHRCLNGPEGASHNGARPLKNTDLLSCGRCIKLVVQPNPTNLSSSSHRSLELIGLGQLASLDPLPAVEPFANGILDRQLRGHSPPIDLVVALQHFLI